MDFYDGARARLLTSYAAGYYQLLTDSIMIVGEGGRVFGAEKDYLLVWAGFNTIPEERVNGCNHSVGFFLFSAAKVRKII